MDLETLSMFGGLGLMILVIGGMWGIFAKAGRPGWYALIPVYNLVTLCRICGLSGWVAALFFIPLVNFITLIFLSDRLAKAFGKGLGFTIGIVLFGMLFLPILGFGDAKYSPPPAV
jgi:hypothetical protein